MSVQVIDEKKKKETGVPTWMLVGGIAAVFAVFTASAVYYIKRTRKQQMRDARYGADYHPEGDFGSKITKYWNLTVKIFGSVKEVLGNALSKNKTGAPLVNMAAATAANDPFASETEF